MLPLVGLRAIVPQLGQLGRPSSLLVPGPCGLEWRLPRWPGPLARSLPFPGPCAACPSTPAPAGLHCSVPAHRRHRGASRKSASSRVMVRGCPPKEGPLACLQPHGGPLQGAAGNPG